MSCAVSISRYCWPELLTHTRTHTSPNGPTGARRNKKCIVGVLGFFFPELGRGNKMLMSSQKSVRYPCYHAIFRGNEVTSPNLSLWHNFPCRNFRCHRPKQFSCKKMKKNPFPSTFCNFCSFIFIFAISSCHSTHAIFLYTWILWI